MKQRFKLLIITNIIFIILIISLISADDIKEENYCKQLGLPEDCKITGSGVTIDNEKKLSFKQGSFITLNGYKYENIKSGEIKLDNEGNILSGLFNVNENGGKYKFKSEFYAPPNSAVKLDKGGSAIITIPKKGSEINELPKSESRDSAIVRYFGEDIKIPGGHVFSGKLDFTGSGEIIIESSYYSLNSDGKFTTTTIDGLNVDVEIKNKVKLFLDGKVHDDVDTYISLGKKNIISNYVGKNYLFIDFKENNPYLKIDSGDHVNIAVGTDSGIELINNDPEIIPHLNVNGNQDVHITEDAKSITSEPEKNTVFIRKTGDEGTTTSPMIISYQDKKNAKSLDTTDNVLGKLGSNYDMIVDNFNRIALIPKGQYQIIASSENIPEVVFSSRVTYNYPMEDEIKELTGKDLVFNKDINNGNRDLVLGRIRDYWTELTPQGKESISEIYVDKNSNLLALNAVAYAEMETGKITFGDSAESFNLRNFMHESTHVIHGELIDSLINSDPELKKIKDSLEKNTDNNDKLYKDKIANILNKPDEKMTDQELKELTDYNKLMENNQALKNQLNEKVSQKLDFEKKWILNAGPYDKIEEKGPTNIVYKDPTIDPDTPKYGYVRAYGGSNKYEDVATIAEFAITFPEKFAPLIDPNSDNYDKTYGPIIRNKLEYDYRIGAIPKYYYEKVLKLAGILK